MKRMAKVCAACLMLSWCAVAQGTEHLPAEEPADSGWSLLSPSEVTLFESRPGEDQERLWSQTKLIFGLGLVAPAVMDTLLPNGTFEWGITSGDPLDQWWDNVTTRPVWDDDHGLINWIGHPYFGGVYYQVARKSGYDPWNSFVYTTLMSTFYWEYGIEAFTEEPSIQDLIITPLGGWLYGEWAFHKEREIRRGGGTVLGSSLLGSTALFFLDPVDNIASGLNGLLGRQMFRTGSLYVDRRPVGRAGEPGYLGVTMVLGF